MGLRGSAKLLEVDRPQGPRAWSRFARPVQYRLSCCRRVKVHSGEPMGTEQHVAATTMTADGHANQ
jgi:hypothetical protein